jgi:hypothetical protein
VVGEVATLAHEVRDDTVEILQRRSECLARWPMKRGGA